MPMGVGYDKKVCIVRALCLCLRRVILPTYLPTCNIY